MKAISARTAVSAQFASGQHLWQGFVSRLTIFPSWNFRDANFGEAADCDNQEDKKKPDGIYDVRLPPIGWGIVPVIRRVSKRGRGISVRYAHIGDSNPES